MFVRLLLTFASVVVVGVVGFEALDYLQRQFELRRRARFFAGGRRDG